jgi:catechol O-methyltransferase
VVAPAALDARVEVIHGTADAVIPPRRVPFDLVFIAHWKDLYLPDLTRLEAHGLLRSGSVVVADNVGFFDVNEYLEYVRSSGRYTSRNVASSVEYRDELPDAVENSELQVAP